AAWPRAPGCAVPVVRPFGQRCRTRLGPVIELVVAPEDLARVRFARSPLDELVQSFLVLLGRKGVDLHRPWVTATRPRLAGLDLSLLEALTSVHRYLPDFIMPPPRDAATTFAAELERVRATDPGEVRRSLAYWSEDELPQALRPLYD